MTETGSRSGNGQLGYLDQTCGILLRIYADVGTTLLLMVRITTSSLRQTAQDTCQLLRHNPLLRRPSIQLIIRPAHTNTGKAPIRPRYLPLRRQSPLISTRYHIPPRHQRHSREDPAEHEAKIHSGVAATVAACFGEVDVEPCVIGKVGDTGVDEGGG